MTSTYINSISRVKTRKLSIRFCEWICQFPTWRRRYCLNILATRMTWRYISHNSLLSGLSFRHSNNHLWHVTCHGNVGNVPLLSFAWPLLLPALRRLNDLTNFAYSQFRKTTLCLWVNLYYRIREHTHTQFWSSSSASATGTVGGGPSVVVVLISSHVKTHLKEYRRFAWSIATMRLPPIWESGSVWTLWMSEDKMKAYMHHEDIVDVSRFMYTMDQYQYNMKIFFFNHCDHLSNVSKWHQHTSTVSRVSRLENSQ